MTYAFEGNRVVRDTGSEFPIFNAPIGMISLAPLVGAVSSGGGMGLMETISIPPDTFQAQYDLIRARTNRPFGIQLLAGPAPRQVEHAEAALKWMPGKVNFVLIAGDGMSYVERVKDAGAKVYHVCDTIEAALNAEDAGIDGVVMSGAEKGGGNKPDNLHSFALLQQARRRTDLPIVASGGIADGIGMAAAFALGAEGVLMGTRFIASTECSWHHNYKQTIADTDHVIGIDNPARGVIMRAAKTPFAEAVKRGEAGNSQNPYAGDALALFREGRTDLALVLCGESAVLIDDVKPAAEIVGEIVREFWAEIERLSMLLKVKAPA